jgi:hypothetical protein
VAQREHHAVFDLVDKPQGACRRHDQTERIGADDALPLPALIAPQPIAGIGVTDGNFSVPLRRPLYTQVMRRLLR